MKYCGICEAFTLLSTNKLWCDFSWDNFPPYSGGFKGPVSINVSHVHVLPKHAYNELYMKKFSIWIYFLNTKIFAWWDSSVSSLSELKIGELLGNKFLSQPYVNGKEQKLQKKINQRDKWLINKK